jgi:hypothetical protein
MVAAATRVSKRLERNALEIIDLIFMLLLKRPRAAGTTGKTAAAAVG